MRKAALAALLALAAGASGCSLFGGGESAAVHASAKGRGERTGLGAEADGLLEADRRYAALAQEAGLAKAREEFLDKKAVAVQSPPDATRLLSWEPRYAEVFAPGDWGWTWGEWQSHEPGAGGRRVGQGRYVTVWRKTADGDWKVRADLASDEAIP